MSVFIQGPTYGSKPLAGVKVGDVLIDDGFLHIVSKRTAKRIFTASGYELDLSGRTIGAGSRRRFSIATAEQIAEVQERAMAKRAIQERRAAERREIESQPGYAEAKALVDCAGSQSADSLLKAYGPDRIIAAWKALEGES